MEMFVALSGAALGSFLAAFTYRLPKGISVVKGRSVCPHCHAQIAWYDNIPLVSFLFLKGKCRFCSKKISLRYPLIEAATAVTFLVFFRHFGFPQFSFYALIALVLIAIFVIDLEHKIIPDELIFPGVLFVFIYYVLSAPALIFGNFFAGLTASVFFLLIHLVTRGRGMGLGDVKFVILGGLILGWPQTVAWLFLAFLTGATVGTFLILLKRAKFGREIPFGPYLAGTLLFMLIFGDRVLNSNLFLGIFR